MFTLPSMEQLQAKIKIREFVLDTLNQDSTSTELIEAAREYLHSIGNIIFIPKRRKKIQYKPAPRDYYMQAIDIIEQAGGRLID